VPLTQDDVREIIRILDASTFDELVLETEGLKLSLRRNGVTSPSGDDAVAEPRPPAAAASSAAAVAVAVSSAAVAEPAAGTAITAPLLGVFYRAPKPGAPPFVEVGQRVGPDTVVGILEVMKLMNQVTAGVAGTIVECVAQDGALVEFGQLLMRLEPEA
jgi:acetyl-CoA carboxylase biotin carboxyl carrier protein